jgi:hypothetical protein
MNIGSHNKWNFKDLNSIWKHYKSYIKIFGKRRKIFSCSYAVSTKHLRRKANSWMPYKIIMCTTSKQAKLDKPNLDLASINTP